MPGVKVVSVYICSHAEIEYVDDDSLDSPVHTFIECPCHRSECNATDEQWFREYEGASPEERDSLKYLWRQLGNINNQLKNIITTFDATNPQMAQCLLGSLIKGPDALVMRFPNSKNREEEIEQWLFEVRDLLKHANRFQHVPGQYIFFEYCLKEATRFVDEAKAQVGEIRDTVRGLMPARVQALRRDIASVPIKAGPRSYVKHEPVDRLVLGVRKMGISKERPVDGLVRGMKGMAITKERRVRFRTA